MKSVNKVVLLVEDNPAEVELTLMAFGMVHASCNVQVYNNGIEVLNYLKQIKSVNEQNFPDLIMLDINLPEMNGIKILEEIRQNDLVKTVPVVMLSSSDRKQDIEAAYLNHANAYLVKPSDFTSFQNMISYLEKFWFHAVETLHHGGDEII